MFSLIPVMVSRLVISLRKAFNTSLVQAWDGDHFTTLEGYEHNMTVLQARRRSPTTFTLPYLTSQSLNGNLELSSRPDPPSENSEVEG